MPTSPTRPSGLARRKRRRAASSRCSCWTRSESSRAPPSRAAARRCAAARERLRACARGRRQIVARRTLPRANLARQPHGRSQRGARQLSAAGPRDIISAPRQLRIRNHLRQRASVTPRPALRSRPAPQASDGALTPPSIQSKTRSSRDLITRASSSRANVRSRATRGPPAAGRRPSRSTVASPARRARVAPAAGVVPQQARRGAAPMTRPPRLVARQGVGEARGRRRRFQPSPMRFGARSQTSRGSLGRARAAATADLDGARRSSPPRRQAWTLDAADAAWWRKTPSSLG